MGPPRLAIGLTPPGDTRSVPREGYVPRLRARSSGSGGPPQAGGTWDRGNWDFSGNQVARDSYGNLVVDNQDIHYGGVAHHWGFVTPTVTTSSFNGTTSTSTSYQYDRHVWGRAAAEARLDVGLWRNTTLNLWARVYYIYAPYRVEGLGRMPTAPTRHVAVLHHWTRTA